MRLGVGQRRQGGFDLAPEERTADAGGDRANQKHRACNESEAARTCVPSPTKHGPARVWIQ